MSFSFPKNHKTDGVCWKMRLLTVCSACLLQLSERLNSQNVLFLKLKTRQNVKCHGAPFIHSIWKKILNSFFIRTETHHQHSNTWFAILEQCVLLQFWVTLTETQDWVPWRSVFNSASKREKSLFTLNILPEQEVTKTTGSDPFKCVHLELVRVVVRFLWSDIWSETGNKNKTYFNENCVWVGQKINTALHFEPCD